MTLSQRLTRAGLSFIVFGTAVSLMPTNGMAFSATDGCIPPAQSYSVGTLAQDPLLTFPALGTGTKSVVLTQFLGTATTTDAISKNDGNGAFTTVISGSTVTTSTTTTITGATDQVTVTFPGSRVVTYTVTAN